MEITYSLVALVGVVMGLTQMVKMAGLPDRYAPLVALVFGIVISIMMSNITGEMLNQAIFTGIMAALSAMGLYSGGKKVALG